MLSNYPPVNRRGDREVPTLARATGCVGTATPENKRWSSSSGGGGGGCSSGGGAGAAGSARPACSGADSSGGCVGGGGAGRTRMQIYEATVATEPSSCTRPLLRKINYLKSREWAREERGRERCPGRLRCWRRRRREQQREYGGGEGPAERERDRRQRARGGGELTGLPSYQFWPAINPTRKRDCGSPQRRPFFCDELNLVHILFTQLTLLTVPAPAPMTAANSTQLNVIY
jgi:hypothetical protein